MKNFKLTGILKTFSKEEMREFDKFISSPYFGCRKFVITYFRILKKYHPEFDEKYISREKLFGEMYRGKEFNDGLVRRMNSELQKYAEEFLMQKRLYKTKTYRNNCLLMELRDRNLQNIFRQKSSAVLKENSNRPEIDFYSLLDRYMTEIEIFNDMTQNNVTDRFDMMERSMRSMILFFLNAFMSVSFNRIRLNREHNDPVVSSFLESIDLGKFVAGLNDEHSRESVLIKTIYYSNICTFEFDDGNYQLLKKLLFKNYDIFSEQQKLIFFMRLNYFFQKHSGLNNYQYIQDELDCYHRVLNEKLFLHSFPYLSVAVWQNYVYACRLSGKPELIKKFVSSYFDHFEPGLKEDFKNYCLAVYYLCKGNLEKSLEHSSGVSIDLPKLKLRIRIMKLQCFYGLGYADSFESEADSLKHFIRNNKTVTGFKRPVNNFLVFAFGALKIKNTSDKKEEKDLKFKIEKEQSVVEKQWLLSILE